MEKILEKMMEERVVAVIREDNAEIARRIADAAIAGGIRFVEITFTIPDAAALISGLVEAHRGEEVYIGAGTVLDAQTARLAILAGAEFIVSPTTDPDVITLCNRYQVLSACGAFTPNEVKYAMECGARIIKVFPASVCNPSYLKALHGPFPQAKFMVTGSMHEDSVLDWIENGASVVGIGGILAEPAHAGDYAAVEENARKFRQIVVSKI